MRQIKIFDTTLRDGEQSPGCSMNLSEKIEIARQLEKLGVDVIEAGFAIASPDDFNSVKTIAETIKNCTVASLARCVKGDIDRAWEAVKGANRPRIHTFLATSEIHMKYKLKMTPEEVVNRVADMVSYAKSLCDDIEFSAEDASRSDKDFLVTVFNTAIESGATTINIPDTVGYATPIEMFDLVSYIKERLVNPDVVISVHCHDDLGLSTANSLAAVRAGAAQVECTINAIGERAGNTSLEEIVMGIKTRADYYNAYTNVDSTQIYRASRLVSTITGVAVPPNKAIVGDNAFAHEAGIHQHGVLENPETYEIMSPETIGVPQNKMVLGKHSGKHAFEDRLKDLGYTLTNDDLLEAFDRFKRLADKKKVVSDRDIEAIVSTTKFQINDKVEFVRYQVNAETGKIPSATVEVKIGDDVVSGNGTGDGPVEACYTVINNIVGIDFTLDEYHVHAVSGGEDALGEAIVKISKDDEIIRGRGLSTDVVEASVLAYINAINKVW